MLDRTRKSSASGDFDSPSQPNASRLSIAWDVLLPGIVVVVPAAIFQLMGVLTRGIDEPRTPPSGVAIAAIIVLQTLGIVAMAVVILVRFENASNRLKSLTNGRPSAWRRTALMVSVACLLLTDILVNVTSAFAGARVLLVAAVPTFLAYLAARSLALAGLPGKNNTVVDECAG